MFRYVHPDFTNTWKTVYDECGFSFVSKVGGASLIMQDTRCTQSQIIFSNTNLLTLTSYDASL
jgi:hypothetical protein